MCLRSQWRMADVYTIAVAAITASAAVFGAAISPLSAAIQNVKRAERDRRDWHETQLREACTDLLGTVTDLRTQVMNNHDYHGPEMSAQLARVRQLAGQAKTYEFAITLRAPGPLAAAATELAAAADRVAESAAASTLPPRAVRNRTRDTGRQCVRQYR